MRSGLVRVENFLAHYASEYYDPVKAREYYLRTRELKGRQSTKGMSDTQKEGWAYAKNQIAERQKAEVQTAAQERQAAVESFRAQAQQYRQQIADSLRASLEELSLRRQEEAKKISADQVADLKALVVDYSNKTKAIRETAAKKIAALPPLPDGATPAERAERAQEVAKLNKDAWNDLSALSTKTQADRQAISSTSDAKRTALAESTKAQQGELRESASASREALSQNLKVAVDKARSDYEARKESIKAQYEAVTQQEYEGLRANLPSAPAKAASGSKTKVEKSTKKPGVRSMTLQEAAVESLRRQSKP